MPVEELIGRADQRLAPFSPVAEQAVLPDRAGRVQEADRLGVSRRPSGRVGGRQRVALAEPPVGEEGRPVGHPAVPGLEDVDFLQGPLVGRPGGAEYAVGPRHAHSGFLADEDRRGRLVAVQPGEQGGSHGEDRIDALEVVEGAVVVVDDVLREHGPHRIERPTVPGRVHLGDDPREVLGGGANVGRTGPSASRASSRHQNRPDEVSPHRDLLPANPNPVVVAPTGGGTLRGSGRPRRHPDSPVPLRMPPRTHGGLHRAGGWASPGPRRRP